MLEMAFQTEQGKLKHKGCKNVDPKGEKDGQYLVYQPV